MRRHKLPHTGQLWCRHDRLGRSYGGLAKSAMPDGVSQDRSHRLDGHPRILRRKQQAIDPVRNQLGQPTDARREHWNAAGHCLKGVGQKLSIWLLTIKRSDCSRIAGTSSVSPESRASSLNGVEARRCRTAPIIGPSPTIHSSAGMCFLRPTKISAARSGTFDRPEVGDVDYTTHLIPRHVPRSRPGQQPECGHVDEIFHQRLAAAGPDRKPERPVRHGGTIAAVN